MSVAARFLAVVILALAAGCASTGGTGPDAGDPRDPLEPMNRAIYGFNEAVDTAYARPLATAYRDVVPEPVRNWVRNFFGNIGDIFIGFNNIIQGKPDDGLQDWVRFAVNSFFGVFGINDVASDMGLEKHNEDFGQTFGRWGFGEGPYLVLPILGSSTLRDGAGTALDLYVDPVGDFRPNSARNSAVALRLVGTRADLLEASRILEEAALDKYTFQRDAYLQRRRSLVYDGRPPRESMEQPEREEKGAPSEKGAPGKDAAPEKRSGAGPVNDAQGSGVEYAQGYNVYVPRIPSNYEAVMGNLQASDHARR